MPAWYGGQSSWTWARPSQGVLSTTVVASHSSLTGTISAYHYFADGAHESLLLAKEIHEALNNRRDRDARIVAWFRRYMIK